MKVWSWLALVLIFAALAYAEAAPSVLNGGPVSGFLTVENSPYTVNETIEVPEGKALVIEAGVTLKFKSGAGLDVCGGSFMVMGTEDRPVVFEGEDGSWNGISLTGNHRAELSYLEIDGAEIGLAVERGSLSLNGVYIRNVSRMALFAKEAEVKIVGGAFNYSEGVGLWAHEGSVIDAEETAFFGNKVGVLVSSGAKLDVKQVSISRNGDGLVMESGSSFAGKELDVEGNGIGLVSEDNPSAELREAARENDTDFSQNLQAALKGIPDSPQNPAAENYSKKRPGLKGNMPTVWSLNGNVSVTGGYHAVWTASDENGDDFPNLFQVPGFFAGLNAYMLMRSSKGRSFEVSANLTMDRWTYFNPENVFAVYKDSMQRVAVGDMFISAGDLYMAGIDVLGGSYDINLLRNSAGIPRFVASVFGGEVHAPKLVGERNKDIYKDYVEEGEAEPQQLMVGGKLRWNLDRRFNATVGFVGSRSELEDPLLRDGANADVNTAIPLTTSKSIFADVDWKPFPGNLQLNAQMAMGGADTAGALVQRAVNKVFSEANLDVSNFAKLRRLMNNMSLVDRLSRDELNEIFGENAMMTESEMRQQLRQYLTKAKNVLDSYGKDRSSAEIRSWDGDNVAFAASLRWALPRTVLSAGMRYVGAGFYSVGSPDQLQNSREWNISLEQKVTNFWNLELSYLLNVENAAHEGDYNVFGFAEGSALGLVPGADDNWLKEHEQDEDRTLYDHTAALANVIDIAPRAKLSLGYTFNYRTRSTNQRLQAVYSAGSGIYADRWFQGGDGNVVDIVNGEDTLKVDSARWASYYALAESPYLATQFEERIMKHVVRLELKLDLPKNVLKVGGVWSLRRDLSRFEQDELISDFDFSDETFGLLGYYFHGGDYFEQSYPVSLNTNIGNLRNMFMVIPRYKQYNRDNMDEFEWRIAENLQKPLVKDFMDLTVGAVFRREYLNRDELRKHIREVEMDVGGSATLGFTHMKNLTSAWTVGALYCNRPDLLSEEYFDLYGSVMVNYEF